jgi:flagellar protein FlgJ
MIPIAGLGDVQSAIPKDDPRKVTKAAQEFEALLIGQMMRQVREASSLGDGDQASSSIMEMAEQQLAQVLAAGGGLGLSKLVVKGLDREG